MYIINGKVNTDINSIYSSKGSQNLPLETAKGDWPPKFNFNAPKCVSLRVLVPSING